MTGLIKRFFSTEIPLPTIPQEAFEAVGEEFADDFARPQEPSVELVHIPEPAPTLTAVVETELCELAHIERIMTSAAEYAAETYTTLYCDYQTLATVIEQEIADFAAEKYAELAELEREMDWAEQVASLVAGSVRASRKGLAKRRKKLEELLF